MTAREMYFFEKVCKQYNDLFLAHQVLMTEADTLREENLSYQTELNRTYREMAQLKGLDESFPVLDKFIKKEVVPKVEET